jgi:hypothetical protein
MIALHMLNLDFDKDDDWISVPPIEVIDPSWGVAVTGTNERRLDYTARAVLVETYYLALDRLKSRSRTSDEAASCHGV